MLRTPLGSERIQRIDPTTGIKVIQITSYPLPSGHFTYEWPSITPDNRRAVFFCQRWASRNAPWDLFRCDTDGLNLFQLTERGDVHQKGGYYGRSPAALTLDGTTIYAIWGTDLCTVDVETGDVEDLCTLEDVCPDGCMFGRILFSASGTRLFINRGGATPGTVRVDLESGAVDDIELDGGISGCLQSEPRLLVQRGKVKYDTEVTESGSRRIVNTGPKISQWTTDEDGGDGRPFGAWQFAHATLLGTRSAVQGCGLPPERCIWISEEGKDPYKLVEGPYFWHSGASHDGEWIVSDTNYPDCGLQLIHVPTRRFRTLCHPGATLDHVEYGHPHPTVSQDGRVVLFRSDRTNVAQLYVALITDEFRESVKAGDLDNVTDKWM